MPVVIALARIMPDVDTAAVVLAVIAIIAWLTCSAMRRGHCREDGGRDWRAVECHAWQFTELIIAIAALQAGEYMLVKASIAGAIVTNSLFMLGASLLLGGLRYSTQEYNRAGGRLYSALLLMATIALLSPSAIADLDFPGEETAVQRLSVALAILLIAAYGLSLLFSLKTHKELFASADHSETAGPVLPIGIAIPTLLLVTVLVAIVSEIFVEFGAEGCRNARHEPRLRRLHRRGAGWRSCRNGGGILRGTSQPA